MMKQQKTRAGEKHSPERVNAFSDGVFAIIITIMVLELKKPEEPTFRALAHLWPTWVSYAVSYWLIAIVWVNHHYLLQHARVASSRLIWVNFAHLFSVSLIPFLTDWMAETKLEASVPVAMYAGLFLLVNITYLVLVWETICDEMNEAVPAHIQQQMNRRSYITIGFFSLAVIMAFWLPQLGFALVCCCLALYLRPQVRHKNR